MFNVISTWSSAKKSIGFVIEFFGEGHLTLLLLPHHFFKRRKMSKEFSSIQVLIANICCYFVTQGTL
jgi:hypothetical protein